MAYKILFGFKGRKNMKEIGEQLKMARESIGVSVEEVAEDLKVKPTQVENIEAGNSEAFDDVFYLKYFIRDYAKYLGLNKEDLVDEFNEYLFDYTSKISIEDIKKAKKRANTEEKKEETKRIASPYTIEHKRKLSIPRYVIVILILVIIAILSYVIVSYLNERKAPQEDTVVMSILE